LFEGVFEQHIVELITPYLPGRLQDGHKKLAFGSLSNHFDTPFGRELQFVHFSAEAKLVDDACGHACQRFANVIAGECLFFDDEDSHIGLG
jgi:hypothetical protein